MRRMILLMLGLILVTGCSPSPRSLPTQIVRAEKPGAALVSSVPTSTPVLTDQSSESSGTLLKGLYELTTERKADLVSKAGWLHLFARQSGAQGDQLSPQELSQGLNLQEVWLSLDDQGMITTAVSHLVNEQGEVIQTSRLANGVWTNLTLGAESQVQDTGPFDPNYGFYEHVAKLVQQGYQIDEGKQYHDCWYQGQKYTISDGHTTYEGVFDPAKKTLRWVKTYQVTGGVVTVLYSREVLVEERVPQPPADVLAQLGDSATP